MYKYFFSILPWMAAAAAAKSLQSCPTLCDPTDGSPPGSPVPGILQAEHWSGLPFPSPGRYHNLNMSKNQISDFPPTTVWSSYRYPKHKKLELSYFYLTTWKISRFIFYFILSYFTVNLYQTHISHIVGRFFTIWSHQGRPNFKI